MKSAQSFKNWNRRTLKFLGLSLLQSTFIMLSGSASKAQGSARDNLPQQIEGANGNLFMQEETPQSTNSHKNNSPRVQILNSGTLPRQDVRDTHGNDFMEETTNSVPQKNSRVPIDLQNSNIQINDRGHIVPLINHSGQPVQFESNSGLQAYQEMPVPTIVPTYTNPLAMPYDIYGRPGALGTAFVPVTPGTIPGIRSMNIPPGYYYGNNPFGGYGRGFGFAPLQQTQYSGTYSQTSLIGPAAGLVMPLFRDSDK